jgi:hypothetical protein
MDAEGGNKHAIPTCNKADSGIVTQNKCGKATCEFPYFDVDGYLNQGLNMSSSDPLHYSHFNEKNNGCEVRDDTIKIGGEEVLNNTPEKADNLGVINKSGSTKRCNKYLPKDKTHNCDDSGYCEELGGPMGTDYYKIKFGINASEGITTNTVDIFVTFTFDTQVADSGANCKIALEGCTGNAKLDKDTGIIDSPTMTTVYQIKNAIKDFKKDEECYLVFKLDSKQEEGIPFPYHFALVAHGTDSDPKSPSGVHACSNSN